VIHFTSLHFSLKKKATLDPDEQGILVDWYNSLTSKGTLGWNTTNDLCGQTGVTCDSSTPQRVSQLYSF